MNAIKVTSWQDDNYFIGFLNEFPEYHTQGTVKKELMENLMDLYIDIESGQIPNIHSIYSPLTIEEEESNDNGFDAVGYCLGELQKPDVIRLFEKMGCTPMYIGVQHDWYFNPKTKQSQPVPRQNQINANLAKAIIKKLK